MRYVLMIYGDEEEQAARTEEEHARMFVEHSAFGAELRERDKLVAGEPLEWSHQARSVRKHGGEIAVTDGPFAETKEALGGFYLIEADSIDEALEWAARMPGLGEITVEVRAVMSIPVPQT